MSPPVLLLVFLAAAIMVYTIMKARSRRDVILERQLRSWRKVDQATALITTYFHMVLKHGPDSEEAKAFKFNVTDKELTGDNDAMHAFDVVSKILDSCLRKRYSSQRT